MRRYVLMLVAIVGSGLAGVAWADSCCCGGADDKCDMSAAATATPAAATTQPSDKKTYTCSMHPDVVSDAPGKCPKCGMKLVEKKADAPATEHDHMHMN